MRRAPWKYHDHAIGTILFVVVFLATTLIDGSPRNHEGIKYFNRRVGFTPNLQMAARRAIAKAEEEKNSRMNDASAPEEEYEEDLLPVYSDLYPQTMRPEYKIAALEQKSKNCTFCTIVLIKQYPEICEIVQKIQMLQKLIPQLSEIVNMLMGGGRRMDFKWIVDKGKNALLQLYEVLQRMDMGLKKFYEALELNFGPALTDLVSQFNSTDITELLDSEQGEAVGARDMKYQDQEDSFQAFRSCASIIVKFGIDPCVILTIVKQIDQVLNDRFGPEVQEQTVGTSEFPIKLHSDNLTLSSFLEALQSSQFGKRGEAVEVIMVGVKPVETVPKGFGFIGNRNSQGRRHLVNENKEDVVEVFETPDFRVELVAPHEISESEQTVTNLRENLGDEVEEVAEEPQARFMRRAKNRRSGSFQYSPRMTRQRVPLNDHTNYQDENLYRLWERQGRRWNGKY